MDLKQHHSLVANMTLECGKIINDPKLNLQTKGVEISKAVNKVYPGMGDQLSFPIYSFLKYILGISKEMPKFNVTGPERQSAVTILSEIFNVDIFLITQEDLMDAPQFEKRKQELNDLIQGQSEKKVLVVLEELAEAFLKKNS